MIIEILSFACIGLLAGLLSGLLGIGGGVVTIPCLLFAFHYFATIPPEYYMHVAIGTTLAAMVFNTFAAGFAHYKHGNVLFSAFRSMGTGTVCGAVLGAYLATILSSDFLQIFFGIFECVLGITFLIPKREVKHHDHPSPSFLPLAVIGFIISAFSALLGLGGGLLNVPVLTYFKISIKKAIGTSATVSFLIAFIGAISFLTLGVRMVHAPESIGFIYIPAFIAMSITATAIAPIGVRVTHILPASILRRIFGVVLLAAGILMLK